jgi:hypothetical protein
VGKTKNITYSERVFVALVTQQEERMKHIMLLSKSCLPLSYFSTCFTNGTIFGKKFIEHKMCVYIFLQIYKFKKNSTSGSGAGFSHSNAVSLSQ